jgi:transcriptional regulator with XRE-family HTH domain
MTNRIRHWRKQRRLTLEKLADRLGTSAGHLHKWETGKVSITLTRLADVAHALEVGVVDLIDGQQTVPVVGTVGAGAQVFATADPPEGKRKVRAPPRQESAKTVALEVEGDAMLPIEDGWLLFYSRDYEGVPIECIGKLCVVQLASGARYVKRVTQGRRPALFNLYSTNAREMEDQSLAWAAPVVEARPPDPEEDGPRSVRR